MLTIIQLISVLGTFFVAIAASISNDTNTTILFVSLLPVALASIGVLISRSKDILSPLYMLFYMCVIGSFVKTALLLYFDEFGDAANLLLGNEPLEILIGGGLALSIATMAFLIGYGAMSLTVLNRKNRSFISDFKIVPSRSRIRLVAMLIGALAFTMVFIMAGSLNLGQQFAEGIIATKRIQEDTIGNAPRGAALGYLRIGAQTLPQIMFFLYYAYTSKSKLGPLDLMILIGLAGLSIFIPFVTSGRLELVYFFFITLVIRHYMIKRFSLMAMTSFTIIALCAVALLGELRKIRTGTEDIQITENFSQTVTEGTLDLLGRPYFMDIAKTALIVKRVPEEVDYLYGSSFLAVIYAPIPRSIWVDKPVIRIGPFVSQEIFLRDNDSGVPPGFVGELYLNFGFFSIFVGMLLIGCLMARIHQKLLRPGPGPISVIVYAISFLIIMFSLLSGDFIVMISQFFRYGIPLALVVFLLGMFKKNKHQTNAKTTNSVDYQTYPEQIQLT